MKSLKTNRGLFKYIFFSIITVGIYSLYIIYAFAKETNMVCRGDGKKTRGLFLMLLFTALTFGIYNIVWYASIISRRAFHIEKNGKQNNLTPAFFILSMLFGGITLGILNLVAMSRFIKQQNILNGIYNEQSQTTTPIHTGPSPQSTQSISNSWAAQAGHAQQPRAINPPNQNPQPNNHQQQVMPPPVAYNNRPNVEKNDQSPESVLEKRLLSIKSLLEREIITEEEYQLKRQQILDIYMVEE